MCGLTGILVNRTNGFTKPEIEQAVGGLFINGLRGRDSTGIITIMNDKNAGYFKTTGDVNDLISSTGWDKLESDIFQRGKAIIGHGRAATKGEVSVENAHPFFVSDPKTPKKGIYLVHNGTLWDHQQLPGLKDEAVDSLWLAKKILELGPMEALGKINGPIATMWYDTTDHKLRVYRNNDRPLHWIQEEGSTLHINSEVAPLEWMRWKYGLKFKGDIHSFAPEKLYTIDPQTLGTVATEEVKHIFPVSNPSIRGRHRNSDWGGEDYEDMDASWKQRTDHYSITRHGIEHNKARFEVLMDLVLNGRVKTIRYSLYRAFIEYEDGTKIDEYCVRAPVEDLLRVDCTTSKSAQFIFSGSRKAEFYTRKEWRKKKHSLLRTGKRLAVEGEFEPGKVVNFHTKTAGTVDDQKTIIHRALCDTHNDEIFPVYTNDKDGCFVKGQLIVFEAHTYREVGRAWTMMEGMLSDPPSSSIDIEGGSGALSLEAAKKAEKFMGRITVIKPQTAEKAAETGGIIRFMVNEIEPLDRMTPEQAIEIQKGRSLKFEDVMAIHKKDAVTIERSIAQAFMAMNIKPEDIKVKDAA